MNQERLQSQRRQIETMVQDLNQNTNIGQPLDPATAMDHARARHRAIQQTAIHKQMDEELHIRFNRREVAHEELERNHLQLQERHMDLQNQVDRNNGDLRAKTKDMQDGNDNFKKTVHIFF